MSSTSYNQKKYVGKSSIVDFYDSKHYNPDVYATSSGDPYHENTFTGELNVHVHDTAGETHEATVIALCARCNAIVLVYDKTYKQSFGKIDDLHNSIKQHINLEKVVVFLVGNKTDETHEEQVNTDEGYNKHKYLKTDLFIETSAKTGYNINELFNKIEAEVKISGKRP
ncbi:RAB6A [Mytilus edulis]|uniref:RAB6A n=1 Tax=Mytilus edulis TaxID=6550 RepID=A0A8S3R5Q9_MYTED|nr:RAB6A [Mytilus edulis]